MNVILRTIYVMWLREAQTLFPPAPPASIGALLGQPLIFLLLLRLRFPCRFQKARARATTFNTSPPASSACPSFSAPIFNGLQIIMDRQFGFLKETLVAPVPAPPSCSARTFGEAYHRHPPGLHRARRHPLRRIPPHQLGPRPRRHLHHVFHRRGFSAPCRLHLRQLAPARDMQGFQLIMVFLVMPLFYLSSSARLPAQRRPRPHRRRRRLRPCSLRRRRHARPADPHHHLRPPPRPRPAHPLHPHLPRHRQLLLLTHRSLIATQPPSF